MGQIHNELRRRPLSEALLRAVGALADTEAGLERFGETLVPVLDLWRQFEWAKFRGEQSFSVRSLQAGVALELAGIAITNPVGSQALIVVEGVAVLPDTAAGLFTLELMLTSVIAGTYLIVTRPGGMRDRRFRTSFSSKAEFIQGTDAAGTFGAQLELIGARAADLLGPPIPFVTGLPVLLRPGEALAVIHGTVATQLRVNWKWRERAALPGELD